MVRILINRDLYRYEIHSLVKAFYPAWDVRVEPEGGEEKRKEEAEHLGSIRYEREEIRIVLSPVLGEGRTLEMSAAAPSPDTDFREKGPAAKDALKTLVYSAMCAYAGRTLPWGDLIGIRPTKIAAGLLEEGRTEEEILSFYTGEHGVSDEKAHLALDIARREEELLKDISAEEGYSLYIGIPFCPSRCLYCSFIAFSLQSLESQVEAYVEVLREEMRARADLLGGRRLDTVYFGGGTPTSLSPSQLSRIMETLHECYPVGGIREFTVEAGRPDSITADKLKVLREAGVSRISVNPQTMNDKTLALIGRRHTAAQVVEAFHLAREEGFSSINMDLILGLPGEGERELSHTLEEIEKLSPESLTVHSLALKKGSRMMDWILENGRDSIRGSDALMDMASESARRMGMDPYYLYRQKNMTGNLENVGFAREGHYGVYNVLIMEEKQPILALGAGAVSKAVFREGDSVRIERADGCKDVPTYLANAQEMIRRKRELFAGQQVRRGL